MTTRLAWDITKETFSEFMEDSVPRLAAALAYYAMFSLGPLLVIVIAVAALFLEKGSVQQEVTQQLQALVGDKAAQTIQTMLTQKHESNILATIIGTVALLFGASGVFGQLQDALNTIWEVKPKPGQGVWGFIRNRFLSFAMVLGIAFLLLVSMVITTGLEMFSGMLNKALPMPDLAAKGLHFTISFAVITLLFAMIFKLLPDAKVKWRDVWVGAIGTALLFTIGKFLIGIYLGRQSTTSAYGAAGSVIVILLWVYYSSIILFLGAEFTQVYARKTGSRIAPSPNAVRITEEKRAEEGIPHDHDQDHDQPDGEHLAPADAHSVPVRHDHNGQSSSRQPGGSFTGALGVGFIGGWLVHRKLTQRKRSPKLRASKASGSNRSNRRT